MTTSALVVESVRGISDGDLDDLREGERRILLAASIDEQDKGALIVRQYKGTPFYEVKWRDFTGTQRKRRLGRLWIERDGEGEWKRRRVARGVATSISAAPTP